MSFLTFSRGRYYTRPYVTFYLSLVAAERSEAALWASVFFVANHVLLDSPRDFGDRGDSMGQDRPPESPAAAARKRINKSRCAPDQPSRPPLAQHNGQGRYYWTTPDRRPKRPIAPPDYAQKVP